MNSSNTLQKLAVIIVAAGDGSRMGQAIPKAYLTIGKESLLIKNINLFYQFTDLNDIIVVYGASHQTWLLPEVKDHPQLQLVEGGATRQASVYNALKHLKDQNYSHVLIHDAARALCPHLVIENVIQKLIEGHQAVIPAMSMTDTIKRIQGNAVTETLPRDELVATQTPQGFDYNLLLRLHAQYEAHPATDDAMLAEWGGIPVQVISGAKENIKITTQEDLVMANTTLQNKPSTIRIGTGFDVHQFKAAGDKKIISLCGLEVESNVTLEGHSDGDVGLHALTDAIFGALALGDLGEHFPSSDTKWKGADSAIFLKHAVMLMQQQRAKVVNADITIIGNHPKISPLRTQMQQRIAALLLVEPSQVSVKATTTDGLGFTGRGEGLAAQAMVLLEVSV